MKKILVLVLSLYVLSTKLYATGLIARQNGTLKATYTTIQAALTGAESGDTLYLPAGLFVEDVIVEKKLVIIGAGQNANYATADGATIIRGELEIYPNASGGMVCGIFLSGGLNSSDRVASKDVDGFTFLRCRFQKSGGVNYLPRNSQNITFKECMFFTKVIYMNSNRNTLFQNCVFEGLVHSYVNGVTIENCVFLWDSTSDAPLRYGNSAVVRNTIFLTSTDQILLFATTPTIFENCIIVGNLPQTQDYVFSNCIKGVDKNSIFRSPLTKSFADLDFDFRLSTSSIGVNKGKDGKNIGIEGGSGFKVEGLPFNPQVLYKNVRVTTTGGDKLDVDIRVKAQTN